MGLWEFREAISKIRTYNGDARSLRASRRSVMKLPGLDRLGSVGYVGERKALALLCLGFYTTMFFLIGLSARTELPEWLPVFVAMTLIYVTAFMGVAAEWFWGRWFATGLGYWGCTMAVMA